MNQTPPPQGPPPIPAAPLPAVPNWQAPSADGEHVKILAIFHFVLAGICGLWLLVLMLQSMLVSTMFSTVSRADSSRVAANFMGAFNLVFYFYVVLAAVGLVLNILGGVNLGRRKSRSFCMVVAGINCLNFPFGTVLGVFTFIVLCRPSVRSMFEAEIFAVPIAQRPAPAQQGSRDPGRWQL